MNLEIAGRILKEAREDKRYTQKYVGEQLGVTQGAINKIEKGAIQRKNLYLEYADFIGVETVTGHGHRHPILIGIDEITAFLADSTIPRRTQYANLRKVMPTATTFALDCTHVQNGFYQEPFRVPYTKGGILFFDSSIPLTHTANHARGLVLVFNSEDNQLSLAQPTVGNPITFRYSQHDDFNKLIDPSRIVASIFATTEDAR